MEDAGARVTKAREDLRAGLSSQSGAAALTKAYSEAVASLVVDVAGQPVAEATKSFGPLALAAIGGLGRGELGPHSDLDLAIVTQAPPSHGGPAFDAFVQRVVHPLWDAGLRANLAVHDAPGWLADASDDLTVCTALLDLRCLVGSEHLIEALERQGQEQFFGDQRGHFLQRLVEERRDRHARFGDTVFLVEPDLKNGPGGVRDLAVIRWCLKATHGTVDLDALVSKGGIRRRVADLIGEARDTLLRLRAALHIAADRAQDRLVFQYQEALPQVLGMTPPGPTADDVLVAAIEEAMQEYYRAARDLLRYGGRVIERCLPAPPAAEAMTRRLDERFAIKNGRLEHDGGIEALTAVPVLAIDALALAREHRVRLSGHTFDAVAEMTASPSAAELADEPEAQRRFLDLLCEPDDTASVSMLALAHELRLLECIVPEFAPLRGRMQHDSYHVYTVDQHTLQAIAMLKRLARGEHNKDYPLATELHVAIDRPEVLYLATLCHDAGKAVPGDQCETGAEIALRVAKRAGLDEADVQRCGLLVREHITMPMLSQKRDLGDPLLIADFAKTVGDPETLRELYLLSLVDTASVRPGNMTSWKLTLLDELYLLARAYLRRGQARFAPRVRRDEPQGMPRRYYSLYHVAMREQHRRLIERLIAERREAILELEPGSGALRLTVVARDRPGLLAQVAAALSERGIAIMAADGFSAPGPPAIAVEVFRIEPGKQREGGVDVETVTAMEQALQRGLSADEMSEPPPPRRAPPLRRRARTPTHIQFDTDPAGDRTIVELNTEDAHDVFYRIALAFAAEGLEILLARINIEARRAVNIFYVPVLSQEGQAGLRKRLGDYLAWA